MKKALKVILIIIVLYFAVGFLFWIYFSFTRIDEVYQREKRYYDRQKTCYDCFVGERRDGCPRIAPASVKKTYPYAQEEAGMTGGSYCYWYPNWENGFSSISPEKSLLHSFEKNWGYSWKGYFFWTFIILTLGQVSM